MRYISFFSSSLLLLRVGVPALEREEGDRVLRNDVQQLGLERLVLGSSGLPAARPAPTSRKPPPSAASGRGQIVHTLVAAQRDHALPRTSRSFSASTTLCPRT